MGLLIILIERVIIYPWSHNLLVRNDGHEVTVVRLSMHKFHKRNK